VLCGSSCAGFGYRSARSSSPIFPGFDGLCLRRCGHFVRKHRIIRNNVEHRMPLFFLQFLRTTYLSKSPPNFNKLAHDPNPSDPDIVDARVNHPETGRRIFSPSLVGPFTRGSSNTTRRSFVGEPLLLFFGLSPRRVPRCCGSTLQEQGVEIGRVAKRSGHVLRSSHPRLKRAPCRAHRAHSRHSDCVSLSFSRSRASSRTKTPRTTG